MDIFAHTQSVLIAFVYMAIAVLGIKPRHTVSEVLATMTFFFCGLGHLVLIFTNIPALHTYVNTTTLLVGLPFAYNLIKRGERLSIKPME